MILLYGDGSGVLIGEPLTLLVPLSVPSFLSPLLSCFLWLTVASSLTLLLATLLMACFVPMMVPLPILAPDPERAGSFPVGGRLVFRPATLSRGLEEELRLLELLVDRVRTFDPPDTAARELLLPLTCPSTLIVVAKTSGESWERDADEEVDAGTPSLGTDLFLPPKLAPLFSRNSSGLVPAKV